MHGLLHSVLKVAFCDSFFFSFFRFTVGLTQMTVENKFHCLSIVGHLFVGLKENLFEFLPQKKFLDSVCSFD